MWPGLKQLLLVVVDSPTARLFGRDGLEDTLA